MFKYCVARANNLIIKDYESLRSISSFISVRLAGALKSLRNFQFDSNL